MVDDAPEIREQIESQEAWRHPLMGAVSHELPFAKHPVTGSFMRTTDIRESSRVGVGPAHAWTTANGRRRR
jgi:hypothetical protein